MSQSTCGVGDGHSVNACSTLRRSGCSLARLLPILPVQEQQSWLGPGFSWAPSVLRAWGLTHPHPCQPGTLGPPSISSWGSAASLTADGKPGPWLLTPHGLPRSPGSQATAHGHPVSSVPFGHLSPVLQPASGVLVSGLCHHLPSAIGHLLHFPEWASCVSPRPTSVPHVGQNQARTPGQGDRLVKPLPARPPGCSPAVPGPPQSR